MFVMGQIREQYLVYETDGKSGTVSVTSDTGLVNLMSISGSLLKYQCPLMVNESLEYLWDGEECLKVKEE